MLPRSVPEATVIVCEDDVPTLDLLCDHLHADRFRALAAPSAADALRLCHYNDPDLLLLDLRLPDASGLDVLREIRASAGPTGRFDPALPVIVLSGRSTEVDRIRGLVEGADDYVAKPFHYHEVAARIRAVLRRRDSRREGPRRIGDLFIDPSRREVRVGDSEVHLANKEFSLLRALAADPYRVFTKEDLLREVWGFRSMGSNRLYGIEGAELATMRPSEPVTAAVDNGCRHASERRHRLLHDDLPALGWLLRQSCVDRRDADRPCPRGALLPRSLLGAGSPAASLRTTEGRMGVGAD